MFWLLRLWMVGLMLVLGWAMISYALTRKRDSLLKARALWRGSLALGGTCFAVWLLLRLLGP